MENENKKRHDLKHFCQTKLHKKRESSVSCSDKSDHCVSKSFANSGILNVTGEIIGHVPEILKVFDFRRPNVYQIHPKRQL